MLAVPQTAVPHIHQITVCTLRVSLLFIVLLIEMRTKNPNMMKPTDIQRKISIFIYPALEADNFLHRERLPPG
jgi:hypothetical protein